MKRISALLLAVLMLMSISLTSCKKDDKKETDTSVDYVSIKTDEKDISDTEDNKATDVGDQNSSLKGETGSEEETAEPVKKDGPVITLVCDKTSVSAGDTVEVIINITDAPDAACFTVHIDATGLKYTGSEAVEPGELILQDNHEKCVNGTPFELTGIYMTCGDLKDKDVYKVTFVVSDDVKGGDTASLSISCSTFHLATDGIGNNTKEVVDSVMCICSSS